MGLTTVRMPPAEGLCAHASWALSSLAQSNQQPTNLNLTILWESLENLWESMGILEKTYQIYGIPSEILWESMGILDKNLPNLWESLGNFMGVDGNPGKNLPFIGPPPARKSKKKHTIDCKIE